MTISLCHNKSTLMLSVSDWNTCNCVSRKGLVLRSCWTPRVSQTTVNLKGKSALKDHPVPKHITVFQFCITFPSDLFCAFANHLPSGSRFAKTLKTAIYGAKLFMMCVFACSFVFLMVLGCCAVDLFSICALHSSARLMSQPYFSVHYSALPPLWSCSTHLFSLNAWSWLDAVVGFVCSRSGTTGKKTIHTRDK